MTQRDLEALALLKEYQRCIDDTPYAQMTSIQEQIEELKANVNQGIHVDAIDIIRDTKGLIEFLCISYE